MMAPPAVILSNAVVATILAVLVYLLSKWLRHPPLIHALWVLVLVKFLAPPLVSWPAPLPSLGSAPTSEPSPPW